MRSPLTRREFLTSAGAISAGSVLPWEAGHIRFGYAAITWGGNDRQAIEDIASVDFRGIQLRGSAVREWGERPEELRELVARHNLTFVALSSGVVRIDPQHEAEDLAAHLRNALFLKRSGGLYLQVVDERPDGRPAEARDYQRMGRLLTELGKRTADLGIPLGYHNHMGNLGERPEEVDRVLEGSDERYVKLELDTAHYRQADGDPAQAVERYAGRLLFLHVKDVESPVPGQAAPAYRFVELGRGKVDFSAFFGALRRAGFRGWAVVELDAVPVASRTPKESALISKRFLEEQLGLRV